MTLLRPLQRPFFIVVVNFENQSPYIRRKIDLKQKFINLLKYAASYRYIKSPHITLPYVLFLHHLLKILISPTRHHNKTPFPLSHPITLPLHARSHTSPPNDPWGCKPIHPISSLINLKPIIIPARRLMSPQHISCHTTNDTTAKQPMTQPQHIHQ